MPPRIAKNLIGKAFWASFGRDSPLLWPEQLVTMNTTLLILLVIALLHILAASIGLVDGLVRFATAWIELATRLLDLFARHQ